MLKTAQVTFVTAVCIWKCSNDDLFHHGHVAKTRVDEKSLKSISNKQRRKENVGHTEINCCGEKWCSSTRERGVFPQVMHAPLTQRVRAPESVEEITRNVDLLRTPLSYDMQ